MPLIDGRITQIKSGCAVAGLGDSWYFSSPYYYVEYTPYVKEMSVRVEGYYHYTKDVIALYDNTGTGGSSWDFFSVALEGIGIVFTAYDIYDWLAKIYQQPPDAEWEGAGHWSRAITRQKTEPAWNPPGGADGWTQMVLYSKLVVRIFGVISRKAVPTFSASRLRLKSMFNHGA